MPFFLGHGRLTASMGQCDSFKHGPCVRAASRDFRVVSFCVCTFCPFARQIFPNTLICEMTPLLSRTSSSSFSNRISQGVTIVNSQNVSGKRCFFLRKGGPKTAVLRALPSDTLSKKNIHLIRFVCFLRLMKVDSR